MKKILNQLPIQFCFLVFFVLASNVQAVTQVISFANNMLQPKPKPPSIYEEAKKGNVTFFNQLNKTRIVDKLNAKDKKNNNWTSLHYAAAYNQPAIVRFILEHPGINVNAGSKDTKATPLHLLVQHQHFDLIDCFIEYKQKLQNPQKQQKDKKFTRLLINKKDQEGNTPFDYLAKFSQKEVPKIAIYKEKWDTLVGSKRKGKAKKRKSSITKKRVALGISTFTSASSNSIKDAFSGQNSLSPLPATVLPTSQSAETSRIDSTDEQKSSPIVFIQQSLNKNPLIIQQKTIQEKQPANSTDTTSMTTYSQTPHFPVEKNINKIVPIAKEKDKEEIDIKPVKRVNAASMTTQTKLPHSSVKKKINKSLPITKEKAKGKIDIKDVKNGDTASMTIHTEPPLPPNINKRLSIIKENAKGKIDIKTVKHADTASMTTHTKLPHSSVKKNINKSLSITKENAKGKVDIKPVKRADTANITAHTEPLHPSVKKKINKRLSIIEEKTIEQEHKQSVKSADSTSITTQPQALRFPVDNINKSLSIIQEKATDKEKLANTRKKSIKVTNTKPSKKNRKRSSKQTNHVCVNKSTTSLNKGKQAKPSSQDKKINKKSWRSFCYTILCWLGVIFLSTFFHLVATRQLTLTTLREFFWGD